VYNNDMWYKYYRVPTLYQFSRTFKDLGTGKIFENHLRFTTKLEESNNVMYYIFIVLNTVHLFWTIILNFIEIEENE
jgi:hypothetical protein